MSDFDGIELELGDGPTVANVPPGGHSYRSGQIRPNPAITGDWEGGTPVRSDPGYLDNPPTALRQIQLCTDLATLADVCATFKTLPPSVREPLRDAYRERAAMIRAMATTSAPEADVPTTGLLSSLASIAAQGADIGIATQATRGVVGLTAADVNPVANMASAAAQAAVVYLDGQDLQGTHGSAIVPVLASEGVEGGYVPSPEALAQVAAMRARQRRPPSVATPVAADAGTLTRGAIVAGAAAEGFGAIVSWSGLKELRRDALVEVARAHGVEPLKAKTTHAQLGLAVRGWDQRGYVVRSITRTKGPSGGWDFKARWVIGTPDFALNSASIGTKQLTVTLSANDSVSYESHDAEGEGLIPGIKAELERLTGGELYKAGDVTDWLARTLGDRFGAIRAWGGFYVRRDHVVACEALCQAVKSAGWGANWGLPALPIATSAQLLSGLSSGLVDECNAVLRSLDEKRAEALKATPPRAEVGARAAATLLVALDKVGAKLTAHAELLGDAHVADVRRAITEAREILRPLADDTSQRFANIADEIGLGH